MKALYTATVTSVGGREGHVTSTDGVIDFDMRPPKEMDGPGGAPNPELLFASGFAACFSSALKHSAMVQKVEIGDDLEVTVSIGIGANGKGGFILKSDIVAVIPGVTQEVADQLVAKADTVCAYSNSTKGIIERTVVAKIK